MGPMRNPIPPIVSALADASPALARWLRPDESLVAELLAILDMPPDQITWYRRRRLDEIDTLDTEGMVRAILAVATSVDLSPILEDLKALAGLQAQLLERRAQLLGTRASVAAIKHRAHLERVKAEATERKAAKKLARRRWEADADTLAREVFPELATPTGTPMARTKPWWAFYTLLEALDPQGYTLERLPRDVLTALAHERITPEAALAAARAAHAPADDHPPLAAS